MNQTIEKYRIFIIAIYHASTKPISRSAGRSAVAAAAYRSGERIEDQRTGLTHDYTRRHGVVFTEIITPIECEVSRHQLWNKAEQAENRKDGRTAREWIIALPAELDEGNRLEVACTFGRELANRYKVAVDISVHLPDTGGSNLNHHAHILTTTRQIQIGSNSEIALGEKATIELSDKKRRLIGLGCAADEIKSVRKLWQEVANSALERSGYTVRIDARSLKDQGIDREPSTHMGYVATEMERRGIESDRGDNNREVQRNNQLREELNDNVINYSEKKNSDATHSSLQKTKNNIRVDNDEVITGNYLFSEDDHCVYKFTPSIKVDVDEVICNEYFEVEPDEQKKSEDKGSYIEIQENTHPTYKNKNDVFKEQRIRFDKLKEKSEPILNCLKEKKELLRNLSERFNACKIDNEMARRSLDEYKYKRENLGLFSFNEKIFLDDRIKLTISWVMNSDEKFKNVQDEINKTKEIINEMENNPDVKEYISTSDLYKEKNEIFYVNSTVKTQGMYYDYDGPDVD